MKYFNKLAENDTPADLKVTKSPLWMHEAGTDRSNAIKKDFKGMAFTGANSPMLSDTTTTTFTGDGSNPLFKKDFKYEQQQINHMSYNEDGASGMNKTDMYETSPDGKKTLTSSDQGGSGVNTSNAIPKDKAVEQIKSKKKSRGFEKDTLSTDLTKGGSLHKEAAIVAPILLGLARILGMGAVRATAGAAARGAAGAGTKALVAGGTRGAAGAAGSGGFWSKLLKPTWGKAGMAAMLIPWGGKGAKGAESVGQYSKMSKLPTGDMGFWEGAKNW